MHTAPAMVVNCDWVASPDCGLWPSAPTPPLGPGGPVPRRDWRLGPPAL